MFAELSCGAVTRWISSWKKSCLTGSQPRRLRLATRSIYARAGSQYYARGSGTVNCVTFRVEVPGRRILSRRSDGGDSPVRRRCGERHAGKTPSGIVVLATEVLRPFRVP